MNETKLIVLRRFIYKTLFVIDQLLKRQSRVVILCYHSIENDLWRFSVAPNNFAEQMQFMKKHFTPVTLSDITLYLQGKKRYKRPIFALTFDDGYQNIYKTVQLLKKMEIRPCVFMLGTPKKANRAIFESDKPLLSYKELRSLKRANWQIGSHGSTHEILTHCSFERLTYETQGAKKNLEKNTASPVNYFSYPKGIYSRGVITEVIKSGYMGACTMNDDQISKHTDPYLLPRVGIDGTHTQKEFETLVSPSVIAFRKLIKSSFLGRVYEKTI